jgi:hypothetical protein
MTPFAVATPLLYLACASALLWGVHRGVHPLSRRAAAVLFLLPLVLTGRAMLTGRVFAQYHLAFGGEPLHAIANRYALPPAVGIYHDLAMQIVPWNQAVRWSLQHGVWPLLDPFLLCGDPLAGSAQPAPYYPVNLLALLLPLPWALTFMAALQLLLAALGAFLYLRELACEEDAALLGAAAWTLSALVVFWIGWPLGAALSLAPLLLFTCRRLARAPGGRSAAWTAIALSLLLLAGHPETAAHLVVIGILAGIAETAACHRTAWRGWLPVLGWGALAGGVALGLGAIFLLPILDVVGQTADAQVRLATESLHTSVPAAEALRLLGGLLAPPPRGSEGLERISAYAGSVLWPLALYGAWRGRTRARWLLVALGALGLAAAARAPGVPEVLARLPLFALAFNDRLVLLGALAIALLAALGADAWTRRADRALPALALGVAVVVGAFAGWTLATSRPTPEQATDARLWLLGWALPPLVGAALLLVGRRHAEKTVLALLAVLLLARSLESGSLYPALDAAAFYPPVRPLRGLPDPAPDPYRVIGDSYDLLPNTATMWGIEDPRGYQALHHVRFQAVRDLWARSDWWTTALAPPRPFLSFLNVRYLLAAGQQQPPGWKRVGRGLRVSLWENPRALPRAFLPRRLRLGHDGAAILREMAAATDFADVAWIEPPGATLPAALTTLPNARGTLSVRERGAGLHLTADLERPGWAAISQTAWRGWRAIDETGRELPLGYANGAFLALRLPAGRHEVDLDYRPRAFTVGLAISGATLTALLVSGLLALARRRAAVTLAAPAAAAAPPAG